jgi:hypothetical protein
MRRFLLAAVLMTCGPVKPVSTADGGLDLIHRTGLTNPHVPSCDDPTQCGDGLEPPLGGPHCPVWLNCRVWDTAQNRCEYIHNLEHGHMVMAYNCTDDAGCAEIVDALTAFWTSQPDPKRILVTPDPLLKTKVAAMVWGWGWQGDSVVMDRLVDVQSHQDQESPEAGLGCSP